MTETDGRKLGGTDCADWGLFQDLSACNELERREGEVLPIPPDLTPHTGKPYETACKWGAASPPFCFRVLELNCDRGAAESTASPGTPTGNVNGWIGLRGDTGKPDYLTYVLRMACHAKDGC
jgi:hypothetical protein